MKQMKTICFWVLECRRFGAAIISQIQKHKFRFSLLHVKKWVQIHVHHAWTLELNSDWQALTDKNKWVSIKPVPANATWFKSNGENEESS